MDLRIIPKAFNHMWRGLLTMIIACHKLTVRDLYDLSAVSRFNLSVSPVSSTEPGIQMTLDMTFVQLILFVCLFVCFVALRPKSKAMVMAGRSVHLTTLFSWASLNKQLTST